MLSVLRFIPLEASGRCPMLPIARLCTAATFVVPPREPRLAQLQCLVLLYD